MAKSHWTKAEPRGCPLIDLVCFYLDDAAQKVIKNKGAPGIDGITYEQKLWVQRGTELPAGSAKSSKVHRRWK